MNMKLLIVFVLLSVCAATEVDSMIDSYLDMDVHATSQNQDQVRFNELTNLLAEASSGNYTQTDITKVKTILTQMTSKINLEGLKEKHALDVLITEKSIWKEKYSIDVDQYGNLITEEQEIFKQREANTNQLLTMITEIESLITKLKQKAADLAARAGKAGVAKDDTTDNGSTKVGLTPQNPAKNCQHVLQSDTSDQDGVFWIDPNFSDDIAPFQVYCDMTTWEGGWTLLISMAENGIAAATPELWAKSLPLVGTPPKVTGLYNGPLDSFTEVWEEIASGKVNVWGSNMTQADLTLVRNQYGYQSRLAVNNLMQRPACRTSYEFVEAAVVPGCTTTNPTVAMADRVTTNNVVGWAVNPSFHQECAFGAGVSETSGTESLTTGSLRCPGQADGSHWARVWFR
eukprot:JP446216.1.p1 GENE.JP446216.1~~JP446216.1.p1  ORF type:complete len:401 (-),score=140.72 JP446216.1:164-1366(-)